MFRTIGPVLVLACSFAEAALGDFLVFDDPMAFEQFIQFQDKLIKGIETFEEGNLAQFDVAAPLSDPLAPGVANVDGGGLGFPQGLAEPNLTIQSNASGANAPNPNPGAGLAAFGPDLFGPGLPNSITVTTDLPTESLDIIFTEPNHTAIGLDVVDVSTDANPTATITVFDKLNGQIVRHTMPVAQTKSFFGIWSSVTIGRINVAVNSSVAFPIVDNIQMWEQGCVADLDDDGTVGILDLLLVLGNWGQCPQ